MLRKDMMEKLAGRNIANLRFADDTDALAEKEQELQWNSVPGKPN